MTTATAGRPVGVRGLPAPGPIRWRRTAIPHHVVLAFLRIGFAVRTVPALFGILVAGPYPRGLFDLLPGTGGWLFAWPPTRRSGWTPVGPGPA